MRCVTFNFRDIHFMLYLHNNHHPNSRMQGSIWCTHWHPLAWSLSNVWQLL